MKIPADFFALLCKEDERKAEAKSYKGSVKDDAFHDFLLGFIDFDF